MQAWGDGLLASLPARARARFRVGRFVAAQAGSAVFALPNEMHRQYCEEVKADVESVLSGHFSTHVGISLVVDDDPADEPAARRPSSDGGPSSPGVHQAADEPDLLDPAVLAKETEPAGMAMKPEERLKRAFPGAVEI